MLQIRVRSLLAKGAMHLAHIAHGVLLRLALYVPLVSSSKTHNSLRKPGKPGKQGDPRVPTHHIQDTQIETTPGITQVEDQRVTVVTLAHGQAHCNRNMLLNVQYQDYPVHLLEHIVLESSWRPNADLVALSNQHHEGVREQELGRTHRRRQMRYSLRVPMKYVWYNMSEPEGTAANPRLGKRRNIGAAMASGKIIVNMDNDDFYHPRYVRFVVNKFAVNSSLQILSISGAMLAKLNPDGTMSYKAFTHSPGAHADSYRKSLMQSCTYSNRPYQEENTMRKCAAGRIRYVSGWDNWEVTAPVLSSGTLFVKFETGLGITSARFAKSRADWNRMTATDWRAALLGLRTAYDLLHEVSRPVHIEPLRQLMPELTERDRRELDNHGKAPRGLYSDGRRPPRFMYQAGWHETGDAWRMFHHRHPDFYSHKNWPYCPGYAKLPGMTTYHPNGTTRQDVESADACCRLCEKASRRDPPRTCTTWTYQASTQECNFFVHASDGVAHTKCVHCHRLYMVQEVPETLLTHDAAVLVAACPLCAKGLQ